MESSNKKFWIFAVLALVLLAIAIVGGIYTSGALQIALILIPIIPLGFLVIAMGGNRITRNDS